MEKSKSVLVNLNQRSYNILIGEAIYETLPEHIAHFTNNRQVAIITTPPVANHYLDRLIQAFKSEWQVKTYQVPDGEESKCIEMAQHLYSWLIRNHFERRSTIVALGGGVIGDLSGFIAATYLRGINLVHLPTSLLAQVDSSIGGKVGVNHPMGKNLIGAFYQPRMVVSDLSVLSTLPQEEFICGMGEVVKYGFIDDAVLFKQLENKITRLNKDHPDTLLPIVHRCIEIKTEIVIRDEQEDGLRALLNFGHTFGHAFESFYQYHGLKHGQAVLLGIKCALEVSRRLNLITEPDWRRGFALIKNIHVELPGEIQKTDINTLLKIIKHDKKVEHGVVHLVLLKGIGKAEVVPVEDELLLAKGFESVLGDG
jgi:3-dehydroquinate synthase